VLQLLQLLSITIITYVQIMVMQARFQHLNSKMIKSTV